MGVGHNFLAKLFLSLVALPPVNNDRSFKTLSYAEKVNRSKCIFCQNENQKERLSSVMTLKMREQIIEAAKFN